MHGDIADDAVDGRNNVVVAQLPLLRYRRGLRRIVVRLGVVKGLLRLVKGVPAGYALVVELALPHHFNLVVLINRQLLLLRGLVRIDGRLLLGGIDFHQHLPRSDVVSGVSADPYQVAVHLGIDRRREPRLDRGNVLVVLRDRGRLNGLNLHRHGLGHLAGRGGRLSAGGEYQDGQKCRGRLQPELMNFQNEILEARMDEPGKTTVHSVSGVYKHFILIDEVHLYGWKLRLWMK